MEAVTNGTTVRPTRTQRSEQEIFGLMEEFENNDSVSVKDFCELYDISDATFYNWQKRYRNRHEAGDKSKGFISLEFAPPAFPQQPQLFAEVRGIKVYREVSASFLKELLS